MQQHRTVKMAAKGYKLYQKLIPELLKELVINSFFRNIAVAACHV